MWFWGIPGTTRLAPRGRCVEPFWVGGPRLSPWLSRDFGVRVDSFPARLQRLSPRHLPPSGDCAPALPLPPRGGAATRHPGISRGGLGPGGRIGGSAGSGSYRFPNGAVGWSKQMKIRSSGNAVDRAAVGGRYSKSPGKCRPKASPAFPRKITAKTPNFWVWRGFFGRNPRASPLVPREASVFNPEESLLPSVGPW